MDLLFPSTLHNTNIIFLLIFSCTVWMLFIVPDKKEFNNTKNPMMAYSILLSMPCSSFLVTYSGKLLSGFFFLSFLFFFFCTGAIAATCSRQAESATYYLCDARMESGSSPTMYDSSNTFARWSWWLLWRGRNSDQPQNDPSGASRCLLVSSLSRRLALGLS